MIAPTATSVGGVLAPQTAAALPQITATSHVARQLWGLEYTSHHSHSFSHCTPLVLPSRGVLEIGTEIITITTDALFLPTCSEKWPGQNISISDLRDPFYASTIPQTYVIAASTVIAWVLVTMLVITPRTAFLGGPSGSGALLYGRGIIAGASGGLTGLTGTGSRPWLQKIATLTAAISLTIASADTFRAAQHQYQMGYMDAQALRDQVLGSREIRIVRVISDIFLWLAQVQTLIRLFPRHKEKVLIKWIGFALIVLDTIFSCLNSFMVNNQSRSPHFEDAIPALSYLFELALGLLYSAWVIYYALTKRRYAFFHPKMRNICIIALLSIVAVSTPVTFFVTDVSNPDVAGWGDYVRWVGAGAASVVVWEWVERIEAIERDEKKDDILGREVFDGDEMLDVAPSEEAVWTPSSRSLGDRFRRRFGSDDDDYGGGGGVTEASAMEQGRTNRGTRRHRSRRIKDQHYSLGQTLSTTTPTTTDLGQSVNTGIVRFGDLPTAGQSDNHPRHAVSPPCNSQTPISRADTTSAASTVYVVRYHQPPDIPQPVRRDATAARNARKPHDKTRSQTSDPVSDPEKEAMDETPNHSRNAGQIWHSVPNPFKRKRASPPKEVQQARAATQASEPPIQAPPKHNFSRWDVINRLGVVAAETGERFRDRAAGRQPEVNVPVTVIPAQPRGSGRMWSPAKLESTPEDIPLMDNNRLHDQPGTTDNSHNAAVATPNASSSQHVASSSAGSTTLVNTVSNPSPSRMSHRRPEPAEQFHGGAAGGGGDGDEAFADAPATVRQSAIVAPRTDWLSPSAAGGGAMGTIVVPAPERRSPSDQVSMGYLGRGIGNGNGTGSGEV